MIAFKELKDILKTSVVWEQKLKDFYDVAEFAMKNEESKKIISLLRGNLEEKLEILEKINPEKFGQTEWVQFAPDYKVEDLILILFEHLNAGLEGRYNSKRLIMKNCQERIITYESNPL